jgi:ATP-dependent protease ClpP protease subunit
MRKNPASPTFNRVAAAADRAAAATERTEAAIRSAAQPQYRFWGSQKPPEQRDPIRAQLSTSTGGTTAMIRLYDPIDSWGGVWGVSAKEFGAALDELDGGVNRIELHLNSPGGEVWEGTAILNMLRQHPADVVAVVDGLAASAASFIAAGCDEVIMAPNSQMMIHDAFGLCLGPAADMRQMADLLDKTSNNVASIYHDRAGGSLDDWRSAMLAETWYLADEAVAAGLADRVAGAEVAAEDAPENRYDLLVFQHAGRSNAPVPAAPADAAADAEHDERVRAAFQRRHALNQRRATAA